MGLLNDSYLVGRALVRVLGDSKRTDEIHRVEEITGQPRYRRVLTQLASNAAFHELLRDRPELSSRQVDYDALRALPATTLGGAYVRHLDSNHVAADLQAAPTQHIDDTDLAYLMQRCRQTHDIWHVLLGLGVAGHEEVIIHWFTWGQLRLPVCAMIMVFGTMKHIVLERRWGALRHSALEAYRAGRDATPLLGVYWERMWDHPLDEVRARHGLHALERRWLD
jgi:ubiquinone biosynthesis protein COQ4